MGVGAHATGTSTRTDALMPFPIPAFITHSSGHHFTVLSPAFCDTCDTALLELERAQILKPVSMDEQARASPLLVMNGNDMPRSHPGRTLRWTLCTSQ
jgi:hypothetical protein